MLLVQGFSLPAENESLLRHQAFKINHLEKLVTICYQFLASVGNRWKGNNILSRSAVGRVEVLLDADASAFKPSKTELAQLAQSADSPEIRSRSARILTQLELESPG